MVIASVFAEAGFATGAGGSGAFAVVGCGVSGFLFPHIFSGTSVKDTYKTAGAGPGVQNTVSPWSKSGQENYGRGVP
jgi:hypothetical protein